MRMRVLKKKGEKKVISAAVVMTSMLVVITMLLLTMSNHYKSLKNLSEVNMILRTYLLRTEAKGYLSAEEVSGLVQELLDCGVSNIRLSGNFAPETTGNIGENYGEASFGEVVILRMEGDILLTFPEADEKTYYVMEQGVEHIEIEKKGVASQ